MIRRAKIPQRELKSQGVRWPISHRVYFVSTRTPKARRALVNEITFVANASAATNEAAINQINQVRTQKGRKRKDRAKRNDDEEYLGTNVTPVRKLVMVASAAESCRFGSALGIDHDNGHIVTGLFNNFTTTPSDHDVLMFVVLDVSFNLGTCNILRCIYCGLRHTKAISSKDAGIIIDDKLVARRGRSPSDAKQ